MIDLLDIKLKAEANRSDMQLADIMQQELDKQNRTIRRKAIDTLKVWFDKEQKGSKKERAKLKRLNKQGIQT